jgi:hypothetical protein
MLRELAQKANAINVKELALQVARSNEGLILQRQRQQLTVGENSEGSDIGTLKSDIYARRKKQRGGEAPFGVPDLKFSGKLYDELVAEITPTDYTIESKVSYSKYNVERYGKKIYGLQKDNAEDIKFRNSKDIVEAYKKELGL